MKTDSLEKEVKKEQNENKPSEGEILKAARKSKGLSLKTVHEATKIPMDALRAIEEGYTIRTLSKFYYQGFLKIYANYLDVDINKVIDNYKREELPKKIEKEVDEFDFKQFINEKLTKKRKQQIAIALGTLFFLFLLFKFIVFFLNRTSKTVNNVKVTRKEDVKKFAVDNKKINEPNNITKSVHKTSSLNNTKVVGSKKIENAIPIPQKTTPKKQGQKPSNDKPKIAKSKNVVPSTAFQKDVTLTVRARRNSWLRVKVDDVVVFQSTLRMGEVETWMADKDIEISGKNINQLEFELNGKMIGTLGRRDRKAKRVVVTKEGLSVKK